jgi:hypothetical protein
MALDEGRQHDEKMRLCRRRKRNNMSDKIYKFQLVFYKHVATLFQMGWLIGVDGFVLGRDIFTGCEMFSPLRNAPGGRAGGAGE